MKMVNSIRMTALGAMLVVSFNLAIAPVSAMAKNTKCKPTLAEALKE